MGALAQVQAQAKTFSPSSPLGRWLQSEVNRLAGADAAIPLAAAITNAAHKLDTDTVDTTGGTFTLTFTLKSGEIFTTAAINFDTPGGGTTDMSNLLATDATDHTGGDFTLTVTLRNGETFTTAAIAYNAIASVIETAIDVAASGVITSWTNGHISVSASGTDLQDGTISILFDGASVDQEPSHALVVFNDSMTGGTSPATRVTDETFAVEKAVNVAATAASIAGWTRGDISLSGAGTLQSGNIILTFSGTSVASLNHKITVMNDSRTGGTPASPLVELTTPGQAERAALALLLGYGIITGAVAAQDAVNDSGFGYTRGNPGASRMTAPVVKALMAEAAAEDDNNATYHAIEEAVYGSGNDRANLVETSLAGDE